MRYDIRICYRTDYRVRWDVFGQDRPYLPLAGGWGTSKLATCEASLAALASIAGAVDFDLYINGEKQCETT